VIEVVCINGIKRAASSGLVGRLVTNLVCSLPMVHSIPHLILEIGDNSRLASPNPD
jgi:hypothetical protein